MAHIFETEPPERYRKALWRKRLRLQKQQFQYTKRLQRVGTGPTPKKFRPFLEAEPLTNLNQKRFFLRYKEYGPTISRLTHNFVESTLVNFTCILAGYRVPTSNLRAPNRGAHIKLKTDLRQSNRLRLADAFSQCLSLKLSRGRDTELLKRIPLKFDVNTTRHGLILHIKDHKGDNLFSDPVRVYIAQSDMNRALARLHTIAKAQKEGNSISSSPYHSEGALQIQRRFFNV